MKLTEKVAQEKLWQRGFTLMQDIKAKVPEGMMIKDLTATHMDDDFCILIRGVVGSGENKKHFARRFRDIDILENGELYQDELNDLVCGLEGI